MSETKKSRREPKLSQRFKEFLEEETCIKSTSSKSLKKEASRPCTRRSGVSKAKARAEEATSSLATLKGKRKKSKEQKSEEEEGADDSWNCSQSTVCEEDLLDCSVRPQFVYFDIETTGLGYSREIVQIACWEPCFEEGFSVYMAPERGFEPGASHVTGLTLKDGALLLRGKRVDTVPLKEGLCSFIEWLKFLRPVVLVGHNARNFDSTRLVLALHSTGLFESFSDTVHGFADSLPVIQSLFPGRQNYRLQSLLEEFCPEEELGAHEALDDAIGLHRVVAELEKVTLKDPSPLFMERLFTAQEVLARLRAASRV